MAGAQGDEPVPERQHAPVLPPWPARRGLHLLALACLAGACLALGPPAGLAREAQLPSGTLVQLSGQAGCVVGRASAGVCGYTPGLEDPESVTVSRDGRHVYVASLGSGGVKYFQRRTAGDLLAYPAVGSLDQPRSVAVSLEGRYVYVASGDFVVEYERNAYTGALKQVGRVRAPGALALALSPGGSHLYIARTQADEILTVRRNRASGRLETAGTNCVRGSRPLGACVAAAGLQGPVALAVGGDGRHVYAVSKTSDTLTGFLRDPGTGQLTPIGSRGCWSVAPRTGCSTATLPLSDPSSVVISPSGEHVYVSSSINSSIALFDRDRTTGTLTQHLSPGDGYGCVSQGGFGGLCRDARALRGVRGLVVSWDGRHVYAISLFSNAIAAFNRNRTTGTLTQLPGRYGCVSQTGDGGACTDGRALVGPRALAISADGKHLYVASAGSDAVAVFRRVQFFR